MHKNRKPIPIGETFNRLTLLEDLGTNKSYQRKCLAKCECGSIKEYFVNKITSGHTKSCGCYREDHPARYIHGKAGSSLYKVYYQILARCHKKESAAYYKYGAKGITVCEEWRNSFLIFQDWALNNGYREGLSIDRIDSLGNYEPTNCRWVNMHIQALNKPLSKSNTSGYKNINWHTKKQKWQVRISIGKGKRKTIGTFTNLEDAIKARNKYCTDNNLIEQLRGFSYDKPITAT